MLIIKRDGNTVKFDKDKINVAILGAMKYGSGIIEKDIAKDISITCERRFNELTKVPTVHLVEDYVYAELINRGQIETAKAYEGFRAVQEFKRNTNTTDESILSLIDASNEEVIKENSNKNGKIASTQRDLIAGEVSKDIVRRRIMPSRIVQAHDNGLLHFHDMDYALQPIFNCCLINLEDMLQNGTVINEKLVETPKSFGTACTIATQIIAQVASNQYGGNSFTVSHLAPFLRVTEEKAYKHYRDKGYCDEVARDLAIDMKLKELKDGVQTIRYQLSTLQTTNGQSPFCTIYLEIHENGEYEYEEALICEEMIRQRLEGMKNYKGQEIGEAFPKLVYLLDEHNCLEGGKYDYITKLAAKCTAKRLVPDYQSAKLMRANYNGTFPPMGCRSHLSPWKDENGENKWYGRFNKGVVSINIVNAAISAEGDLEKFWKIFDERLELCHEALVFRYELLKGTKSDVSPIHWQHGAIARLNPGESIDRLLEGGYSSISLGYVGVCEACYSLIGESNTTAEGEKLALEIMQYMKDKCSKWNDELNIGFSLYGTPAESLIYKFARLDKSRFGVIENVTDKDYYTNSYHVHVTEKIDAFSKLKYESQFHSISSGGCISYVEVPDMTKNIEGVEAIINYIYHTIQYAEINTKPDICYKCGFQGEIENNEKLEWVCPHCGNKDEKEMQVMRRTCGYIGTNYWNRGRTQEIKERVIHL